MDSKKAMKLALEALKWNMDYLPSHGHGTSMASKAIAALREALAEQPASGLNPLWVATHPDGLTTPQPAQQEPVALPCCGYTDASAVKWNPYNQVLQCHNCGQVYTSPQAQPAQQEPVGKVNELFDEAVIEQCGFDRELLVYTSPPAQRTWVGLTHDEYDAICDKHSAMSDFDFLDDIEAKLMEKNT